MRMWEIVGHTMTHHVVKHARTRVRLSPRFRGVEEHRGGGLAGATPPAPRRAPCASRVRGARAGAWADRSKLRTWSNRRASRPGRAVRSRSCFVGCGLGFGSGLGKGFTCASQDHRDLFGIEKGYKSSGGMVGCDYQSKRKRKHVVR